MKKQLLIFLTICCFPFMLNAQMPERTPENIGKYKELCRAHIYKDMKGMYREAGGALVFPFLAPGSNQYLDMLWDWDSWLSNIALRQILLENGTEKDKQERIPVVTMVDRAAIAQRVKNNYMNKIAVFDDKIAEKEYAEQNVIMEMNNALGSDQFHIYLQPKVDMITGRIVGSEALVRWLHPTKGVISPVDFVPIFEGNGFISEIDFYMLEQVCKMIRRWLDKGLEAKPVSVNLSRSNLYSPRILNDIMTCVERYSVPHDLIEFEITESAFAVDNIHLNQLMEQLQKNHFRVLMDDFGSGYSSLNALRELSVDILKIDIKFLPVSQNDKRADIILRSVTQMADQLGLEMVVEGVETEAQADLLKKMGCRIAQGFLYYRPMPIEEYERVLKKQK